MSTGKYVVKPATGWGIFNSNTGENEMEATSENYAKFICSKLNSGSTMEEIENREHPDMEYFEYARNALHNFDNE